jgi:pyruvate/2-oxoglutarate dehydrogenase complex dihydrolipoamide acyltransferase (E2) component
MKRRANEVEDDGTVVQRKYIDVKFVLDERIVDGYYYATFFKYFRRLMRNPEILDLPPEEVIPDIP